jgi:hydroxymethylpyrimidine/phosphomethylpyrimidine kinase
MLWEQLCAVLEDFPVAAIKTGLLPGTAAIKVIAKILARFPQVPLVVDPVIGSTSGTRFLSATGLRALMEDLLPGATLVTPNWPEASALTGVAVRTFADAEQAGQQLAQRHRCAVLVKGGHAPGRACDDCLVTSDGNVKWFRGSRIATRNTHGTGCVLSAAIAAQMARGRSVEAAVAKARRFLGKELRKGRRLDWGGAGAAFAG